MSVTFFIVTRTDCGYEMAYRCDCSTRWCDACDAAWERNEVAPETFTCDACTDTDVNMANGNAADWMRWVGLNSEPGGEIKASELAALCRRRLWDEDRNHDPARRGDDFFPSGQPNKGARVIVCDRRPGYLREQTERVLRVCEKAGDRFIAWG